MADYYHIIYKDPECGTIKHKCCREEWFEREIDEVKKLFPNVEDFFKAADGNEIIVIRYGQRCDFLVTEVTVAKEIGLVDVPNRDVATHGWDKAKKDWKRDE